MENATDRDINSVNPYFTLYTSTKTMVQGWIYSYSFALYVMVLVTLFKYRKSSEVLSRPFYKICMSLGISDLIGIFLKHVVSNLKNGFVTNFILYAKIYYFISISMWYSNVFHQLVIAIDRLAALAFPIGTEQKMFGGKRMRYWLGACWLSAGAISFPHLLDYYQWIDYGSGTFFYFNPNNQYAFLYGNIRDWGIQPVCIILTIGIQIMTAVKFRVKMNHVQPQQNGTTQNRNPEVRLLIQAVLVTIPSVICVIGFYISVYVKGMPGWLTQAIRDVGSIFGNFFHTLNPVVYLIFGSELRKNLCGLFLGVSPAGLTRTQGPAASRYSRPRTDK